MPLSPEQEALRERLEKGEGTPTAAALIRQQAHEIDDLWDRLTPELGQHEVVGPGLLHRIISEVQMRYDVADQRRSTG